MSAVFRILYAEDNALDADLTRACFAEEAPDFEIEPVETGQACLDRLTRGGGGHSSPRPSPARHGGNRCPQEVHPCAHRRTRCVGHGRGRRISRREGVAARGGQLRAQTGKLPCNTAAIASRSDRRASPPTEPGTARQRLASRSLCRAPFDGHRIDLASLRGGGAGIRDSKWSTLARKDWRVSPSFLRATPHWSTFECPTRADWTLRGKRSAGAFPCRRSSCSRARATRQPPSPV